MYPLPIYSNNFIIFAAYNLSVSTVKCADTPL